MTVSLLLTMALASNLVTDELPEILARLAQTYNLIKTAEIHYTSRLEGIPEERVPQRLRRAYTDAQGKYIQSPPRVSRIEFKFAPPAFRFEFAQIPGKQGESESNPARETKYVNGSSSIWLAHGPKRAQLNDKSSIIRVEGTPLHMIGKLVNVSQALSLVDELSAAKCTFERSKDHPSDTVWKITRGPLDAQRARGGFGEGFSVWLDPAKGYLPVKWRFPSQFGGADCDWVNTDFAEITLPSKEVVWLPFKTTCELPAGLQTVTVSKASFNQPLTAEALRPDIPPGYLESQDGRPINKVAREGRPGLPKERSPIVPPEDKKNDDSLVEKVRDLKSATDKGTGYSGIFSTPLLAIVLGVALIAGAFLLRRFRGMWM